MDRSWLLYYRVAFDDVIVVVNKPTENNNTISLGDNKMIEENDVDEIELTMPDWDLVMNMPNIERYIGKWVSVIEGEIAAIGDSLEEVYHAAMAKRIHPMSDPFITRIPNPDHHMILAAM